MMREPVIIAVIPAFNEADTIGSVIRGILAKVSRVVVVDDGSTDTTLKEAQSAGAEVVSHAFNMGYDASLNHGFSAAMERGADIVVTVDADGEHDPDDVAKVVIPIVEGRADICVGQRGKTSHGGEKVFAMYTKLKYGIADPLCGLKAYHKAVYQRVGFFDSVGSIGTELMVRGILKGFSVDHIPINVRKRLDTSRFYKMNFRANIKIIRALWRVCRITQ